MDALALGCKAFWAIKFCLEVVKTYGDKNC